MKKQKKFLVQIIVFFMVLLSCYKIFATDNSETIELSEDYKKYLELSDEEKEKVIAPRMYDIPKTTRTVTNPLKLAKLLGATVESSYSLRDVIPANMVIKNQQKTNSCWAFASLGMLESTLALKDYKNGKSPIVYDFSERHMEYATSYTFKDGVNKNGFNRSVGNGAIFNVALSYLTNGMGAISEADMPFENNTDLIELSKIQNKEVKTQVNDTIDFPSYTSTEDTTQIKQQMKEHIKSYGGIYDTIHTTSSLVNSECYNNKTGAIYCDDSTTHNINHGILIVGWDDNYSKDNFLESKRPNSNGAWIIKNSWGTELSRLNLDEMKQKIITDLPNTCAKNGWTSVNDIPDDEAKKIFINNGYIIENNEAVLKVGDNGFMYVSYEDVNVYKGLEGIINAQSEVTYDNIYQHDQYGGLLPINSKKGSKVYLASVFDKKTQGTEYLTQVSINAPETYTCKVYINPNGTSKNKSDLKQVQLKTGKTETVQAGYHTIEFLNPIQITGNKFVIVIEVQGTQTDKISIMAEFNYKDYFGDSASDSSSGNAWNNVITESGKCFIAYGDEINSNTWTDTATVNETSKSVPNYYTTVKAFTISKLDETVLKGIEITTPPTKTSYEEGEEFDKTGMVVKAKYSDGSSKEITDYTVKDGANLAEGKTSVTIEYQGKTVVQKITVEKKAVAVTVTSIRVKTMPTKTVYIQDEDELNLEGGVIEVTYSDGSKTELPMTSNDIAVSGFDNSNLGKNTITITYKGKTTQFDVEIKEDNDEDNDNNGDNNDSNDNKDNNKNDDDSNNNGNESTKKPVNSNFDAMKGNVTRMRAYYFSDATKKEYTILSIDLSAIEIASGNDKLEYYYYLSSNPQESSIKNWIKIENLNKTENKLSFEINTLDSSNYEEISNADTLYLYIKEVATLNTEEQIKTTSSLKLEVENINVEKYVDGNKKEDVDSGTIVNPTPANKSDNKSSDTVDNTVASGIIPKAGKGMLIIGLIFILIIIGRVVYLKYKDIQIK